MEWAIRYLRLPLTMRRRYYALIRQQTLADPANRGQRLLSFAEFEKLARNAARIRQGPAGDIQL